MEQEARLEPENGLYLSSDHRQVEVWRHGLRFTAYPDLELVHAHALAEHLHLAEGAQVAAPGFPAPRPFLLDHQQGDRGRSEVGLVDQGLPGLWLARVERLGSSRRGTLLVGPVEVGPFILGSATTTRASAAGTGSAQTTVVGAPAFNAVAVVSITTGALGFDPIMTVVIGIFLRKGASGTGGPAARSARDGTALIGTTSVDDHGGQRTGRF